MVIGPVEWPNGLVWFRGSVSVKASFNIMLTLTQPGVLTVADSVYMNNRGKKKCKGRAELRGKKVKF